MKKNDNEEEFYTFIDYEDPDFWPQKRYYVYCYKNNINKKVYIGKTSNLAQRKARHRRNMNDLSYTTPFYKALRKHGEDNFNFSILTEFYCEDSILEIEKFYIKLYDATNIKYGYNLTEGGEGSSGLKHNEKQIASNKLKIGIANSNSKLNDALVINIFNDYKSGKYYYIDLAEKYKVSPITIGRILSKKSWKHLDLDIKSLYSIKLNHFRK